MMTAIPYFGLLFPLMAFNCVSSWFVEKQGGGKTKKYYE